MQHLNSLRNEFSGEKRSLQKSCFSLSKEGLGYVFFKIKDRQEKQGKHTKACTAFIALEGESFEKGR